MIRIINQNADIPIGLERAKRQILAIRHELEQDGNLSDKLGLSFSVVDDALAEMMEELKSSFA